MALVGARLRTPVEQQPASSLAEDCLDAVARKMRVVRRVLGSLGDTPLEDYVARINRHSAHSYQDHTDLADVVRDYTAPLLGETVAESVAKDLALMPVALTANHHGVDFFAQSIQSSLLFSLRGSSLGDTTRTLPVFACATVPLNNITFPRGLLLYGAGLGSKSLPLRLPVFPERCKRELVCRAGPFDSVMLERVERRAQRLLGGQERHRALCEATRNILEVEFSDPAILELSSYSDQAVVLNHRLWKRLFREPFEVKDLVYLELEKVAARLLCRDLVNVDSLAFRVFFDEPVRDSILKTLDGQRACWDLELLRARVGDAPASATLSNAAGGTVFFWGIDECKRRIPLLLDVTGGAALVGVGERGERLRVSYDADTLCEGLCSGALLPSLFSSYLVIALARGVSCLGGYYQAAYLPVMQSAVLAALGRATRHTALAENVALAPTGSYLSGMQAVMSRCGDRALVPAGALEIIAGGGLSTADVERIGALRVRSAHLASIAETVLDVAPELAVAGGWFERVGTDLHRLLETEVVVK